MKTYFRLLSFAQPIARFAVPYIIFTVLGVIFNTLNLALLAPLMSTLFNNNKDGAEVIQRPDNWDVTGLLNYYAQQANDTYGPHGALQIVCGVIVTSILLSNIFKYFSQRVMENLRIHTLLNLRKTVFNNVMNLHTGYFSNQRKGDIISKIASDVQVVQFSVTGTLQVVFKEPLQLLAYVFMLFATSAKLTFFAILVIPISAFIISKIVKRLKEQATMAQHLFGLMISYLDEALSGIKIIKAFNATEDIKEKFHQENIRYSELGRKMARRQQLSGPVSEFLGVTMVAIIVLYGGSLILDNQSDLSVSKFVAYIALFSQVMRPAKALTDSFSTIHAGIAAGERVLDLVDEKPEIQDAPDAIDLKEFNHSLTLQNVSFAYQAKPVLKSINLTIPKGKTVALVGPSGGGKSTLMDLLPRFIDAQEGSVSIDNLNVKQVKMESLWSLFGVVNQESMLFNDTIYNNIAFGNHSATPEKVEAAARVANAHDFIMGTEKGYDSNIGDRGMKLSGGQKQRICIARAVLKNPPIMLLDEATSALDTESEKLVQEALNNLMQNRTSLVIAHRLSTIQKADSIVVLEDGQIVEQGNHSELIARDGLYKRLIDMQTFND
ncbi:ABC transporter ATP-binding protein/permease [Dyadobacter chenwenxiniae]|uniref:ABC transporter ATP-binding protein/permease n=1 Tax=Dyadobacter chenwenxiniae TaxID=2906456 RepID=A0A9X1TFX8_9BACT|nr:ABC transporter ATP-binding protein [Dyadobacter chenwenxiniae]MCF0050722.1 ABC transporter ATP-binding protein/permease [Dyadobacter chenwenxiniae]MCF0063115.1 ABC transporter ATP-binding protein/permease [Dyadobacter chenwenxiniae]UON84715.1 ABC transporter ATP-binding protein/permease [Dyadobacter chenwenxiniae]